MPSASLDEPFRFSIDAASSPHPLGSVEADADGLMRETRRELRQIVGEVSSLCHSRIPNEKFWPKFLNLVGTAMAANGGLVWEKGQGRWVTIHRCGAIQKELLTAACHANMIHEVGDSGGPVVVPPGSPWDAHEPGNPTENLAAVVPVPLDPDEPVKWLIELLLPVGGGPATQRGYLRFIAQMADLAAEFLRAERLQRTRDQADFATKAANLLADLNALVDTLPKRSLISFDTCLVDAIREFSSAERVSLVMRSNLNELVVTAVSGVATIDKKSPAVEAIRKIASQVSSPVGLTLSSEEFSEEEPSEYVSDDAMHESQSLVLRSVVVLDQDARWRLVVEDLDAAIAANQIADEKNLTLWNLLARQLGSLLRHVEVRQRSMLFGGITSIGTRRPSLFRRALTPFGIIAVLSIACLIPVPLVVTATGTLQPTEARILYAPRTAIVRELLVEHGQAVSAGQPLIRLFDSTLEQQISSLEGRVAVLQQRLRSINDEQTLYNGRNSQTLETLSLEQRSIEEELRSLNAQLVIHQNEQAELTLSADRDGIVDGWQLEQRLSNRPIPRGQPLLRIVPENQPWLVHAEIPQDRLNLLPVEDAEVRANIVLTAFPQHRVEGTLLQIGPVAERKNTPLQRPAALAILTVKTEQLPILQTGAPVEIGIHCGHRPVVYVMALDLIRMTSRTIGLYW